MTSLYTSNIDCNIDKFEFRLVSTDWRRDFYNKLFLPDFFIYLTNDLVAVIKLEICSSSISFSVWLLSLFSMCIAIHCELFVQRFIIEYLVPSLWLNFNLYQLPIQNLITIHHYNIVAKHWKNLYKTSSLIFAALFLIYKKLFDAYYIRIKNPINVMYM